MLKHKSIKHVMFHANDSLKHDVCWSELGNAWMVENEKEGLISTHSTLCGALTAMHVLSTNGGYETGGYSTSAYARVVPDQWTMTDNPYGGD